MAFPDAVLVGTSGIRFRGSGFFQFCLDVGYHRLSRVSGLEVLIVWVIALNKIDMLVHVRRLVLACHVKEDDGSPRGPALAAIDLDRFATTIQSAFTNVSWTAEAMHLVP